MPLDVDRTPALAELIRRHRAEAGISQTDVADALGTFQQTVSTWETGEHVPAYRHLVGLVSLIGLDPVMVGHAYGLMLALDAESSSAGQGEPQPALTAAARSLEGAS